MSAIRFGRLLPGAQPIGIGISGAQRGIVRLSAGDDITAIVKPGTLGQIAAELYIASLAKELGLEVPEPILVLDPNGNRLLAGSVDVALPNLCVAFPTLDPNNVADLRQLATIVSNWPEHLNVAAFDEWIANLDRNLNNLLWNGSSFILIDHSMSLQQQTSGMPDANKLVVLLLFLITDDVGRRRILNQMSKAARTFDESQAAHATHCLGGVPVAPISSLASGFDDFLKNRLPIIGDLIKARFPGGQQILVSTI